MMDVLMPMPLLVTGPGGDFVAHYVPRGRRLVAGVAGSPGPESEQAPPRPVTLFDRLLGIGKRWITGRTT